MSVRFEGPQGEIEDDPDQEELWHRVYLKYLENPQDADDAWLSLADPNALGEVVECSDEWYASVGLFLPPECAWLAVEDFCRTGGRSDRIQWIEPSAIPDGGNW